MSTFVFIYTFLKGESVKNERPPSSGSQMNRETENFQEEKQNESETLDLSVASCSDQCKRADAPEDDTRTKPKQDIPVAFAIPAHEVSFVRDRNRLLLPRKTPLGTICKRNRIVMNYICIDCL